MFVCALVWQNQQISNTYVLIAARLSNNKKMSIRCPNAIKFFCFLLFNLHTLIISIYSTHAHPHICICINIKYVIIYMHNMNERNVCVCQLWSFQFTTFTLTHTHTGQETKNNKAKITKPNFTRVYGKKKMYSHMLTDTSHQAHDSFFLNYMHKICYLVELFTF